MTARGRTSFVIAVTAALAGCADHETGSTVPAEDADAREDTATATVGFGGDDATTDAADEAGATAPDATGDSTSGPADAADAGETPPTTGDEVGVYCGSGAIHGRICGVSTQTFIDGAQVWVDAEDCDGNMVHRETVSDGEGFYTLTGVPNGLQTVNIKRDDFETTQLVDVPAGGTADVTGVAYKLCYWATSPPECEPGIVTIPIESKVVDGMVDIVLFVDTSGSMDLETNWVKENLNAFADIIGNANVDFHVVLIGEAGGDLLCVPEPLGGPGCTDGPSFRHVHAKVGSDDGLEKVAEAYPIYQDFLRAGASTNFIAVTDDNSDKSASWFTSWVNAQQNPGFSADWVFHSIVAMGDVPFIGCITGAFAGLVYMALSDQTGGSKFPVCSTDWTSIFEQMATSVISSIDAACIYELPDTDQILTADSVTLAADGPAGMTLIPSIADAQGCTAEGGWHVDDPTAPTLLVLCPATCEKLTTGTLVLSVFCH